METVKEIMTSDIIWANKDDYIIFIAEVMKDKNISCVIIKDSDKPAGIITERDMIKKVIADGIDPAATKCGEVMSTPLFTVNTDTKIEDALNLMSEKKVRRLVITQGNDIVGVINEPDLLAATKILHASHKRMSFHQNIQSYVIIAIFSFVFMYMMYVYVITNYMI